MDNQHRKIKGYRELSPEEIDLMNKIKEKGKEVGDLVGNLIMATPIEDTERGRWLSIGKIHLQQGFMALTRSVAKPTFF